MVTGNVSHDIESMPPSQAALLPAPTIRLPSDDPLFFFEASFVVRYECRYPVSPPSDPGQIAAHSLYRRAGTITCQRSIVDAEIVRAELEAELGQQRRIDQYGIVASGHCSSLDVNQQERDAVEQRRKTLQLATVQQWRRLALNNDIDHALSLFADPRRATAWWFVQHTDGVDKLAEIARHFLALEQELSPVNIGSPEDSWDEVMSSFLRSADSAGLELVLVKLMEQCGQPELAERARRLCTAQTSFEDGGELKLSGS